MGFGETAKTLIRHLAQGMGMGPRKKRAIGKALKAGWRKASGVAGKRLLPRGGAQGLRKPVRAVYAWFEMLREALARRALRRAATKAGRLVPVASRGKLVEGPAAKDLLSYLFGDRSSLEPVQKIYFSCPKLPKYPRPCRKLVAGLEERAWQDQAQLVLLVVEHAAADALMRKLGYQRFQVKGHLGQETAGRAYVKFL